MTGTRGSMVFSIVVAVLLCACILPFTVNAAQPAVYANYLSLERAEYNQGETVRGVFELANQSDVNATAIYYAVRLVGEYDDSGLPQTEYASSNSENMFLKAGEKRTVPFEFTLPGHIAGDELGIDVQVYSEGGSALGWDSERISVEGVSSLVRIADVVIIARESVYAAQEGPTLDERGGKLSYVVSADTAISARPIIEVYRRTVGEGAPIFSQTLDSVSLSRGVPRTLTFDVPVSAEPGVYEGVITFVRPDGASISNRSYFRYIVGGETIATIAAVSSDREYARAGEIVVVSMRVLGTPPDISDDGNEEPVDNVVDVNVILTNEGGAVVGESSVTANLDENEDLTIPVSLQNAAASLAASVVVSQRGQVLAERSVVLSSPANDAAANAAAMAETGSVSYLPGLKVIGLSAAALLIVVVLAVVLTRARKETTIPLAIVLFGIGMSLQIVSAFTVTIGRPVTADNWQPDGGFPRISPRYTYDIEMFINNPQRVIAAGEEFYLEGTLDTERCGNQPQVIHLRAIFEGVRHDYDYTIQRSGGHGVTWYRDLRFRVGPFTAPSAPGLYDMEIGYAGVRPYKGMGEGFYGYETLEVLGTSQTCTNGAQNFPDCSICPTGESLVNGQCTTPTPTCPTGETWNGSACVPTSSCPPGGCPPTDNCPIGYTFQSGECVYSGCPPTHTLQGSICEPNVPQCVGGFYCRGAELWERPSEQCSGLGTFSRRCVFGCSATSCVNAPYGGGNIIAEPSLLQSGDTTRVSWDTNGMTSCVVSENNPEITDGSTELAATLTSSPIRLQTTYLLTCETETGGTFTDSATVNIAPQFEED